MSSDFVSCIISVPDKTCLLPSSTVFYSSIAVVRFGCTFGLTVHLFKIDSFICCVIL